VRVPPPFFFVAGWIVAWFLALFWPLKIDGAGVSVFQSALGVALLAGGLGLMAWALVRFRRARTPIVPIAPARLVVMTGPFRLTRNPMYLGLTAGHLGLALVLNHSWAVIVLPLVLIALSVYVIEREEAHLAATFGDDYARYRQAVRRWL
jgi:protein-S-isoprenylcysteine O-methyltransferase Ste14